MRHFLEMLSNVVGGISIMLLVIAVSLGTPKTTLAQEQVGCTNGGGGNTKCVAEDADGDGRNDTCTGATAGQQCDTNISCTCNTTTVNACSCS